MNSNITDQETKPREGVYRKYFYEMPCFVSIQDRELRIVDFNRFFKENIGAQPGEYCYEVYKGRLSKCDECPVEKTFLSGEPMQSESQIKTLKGKEIPVSVFTSPIYDDQGDIESVLKISTDISHVKKIQKRLHETQKQLHHFFDESPCYITIQDRELMITHKNRRFREDFGGGGMHCYEAYKHREEPCLECPVAKTFEDGQPHSSEEVVTAMSGENYNVLVSTAPLRNGEGEITHVVEMSTNITEIRQLQDQLTSLGLLVSSISHGIKGLASSLDGGMYLMNSGLEKNDRDRVNKGWDIVQRNVNRMRSMIADILYYAKDRDLNYESEEVSRFVSDIVSVMESKAGRFKVEFKHEFAPSLGEFKVDIAALQSALINILDNSFDSCRKDLNKQEHTVTFRVYENTDTSQLVFDVTDNGMGMDKETKNKIFSLFFSSKGIEGTGLGLFISNKIIKKHGGTIEVSSKPGEGANFLITIPRIPHEEKYPDMKEDRM